jgi:hypothetical protein
MKRRRILASGSGGFSQHARPVKMASEKQKKVLLQLGHSVERVEKLTAKEAFDLISKELHNKLANNS